MALFISLDFELLWGAYGLRTSKKFKKNVLTGKKAIPSIIQILNKYNVESTWACVGALALDNKNKLVTEFEYIDPKYPDLKSFKNYFKDVGNSEEDDPLHFGKQVIEEHLLSDKIELASHSFTHLRYLDQENREDVFDKDTYVSKKVLESIQKKQIETNIFPKNQYSLQALKLLKDRQFLSYRPSTFFSGKRSTAGTKEESFSFKIKRILKETIPNSNQGEYTFQPHAQYVTRFLRPFKSKMLSYYQLNIIKSELHFCALNQIDYHLWWHPHNFGINPKLSILQLETLLQYFDSLRDKFNFPARFLRDGKFLVSEEQTTF